ncbi:hypothetical protein [Salinisphaera aquimarina]|uniref:Apea-like HEPN domain-containing protein n=1 Tax=Salinisphaera aquimarina TaxID=2094031 RepID=A0ABV7ESY8_9GAMM
MQITARKLPDRFLIVPNLEEFFGEVRNRENGLDLIDTHRYADVADIYLSRLGTIGFTFMDSGPLASIDRLETTGSGAVPEYVMQNHDDVVELQGRRIIFANFIAGAIFGHLAALRHSAMSGAQYAGMDEILAFTVSGAQLHIEHSKYAAAVLNPKIRLVREEPARMRIVTDEQRAAALSFLDHIADRHSAFESVDLQACMVMNYQAAILHNEQHAAASLALNFSVAEALIDEIFRVYGLLGIATPKPFATRGHTVAPVSNTQFARWKLQNKIEALANGKLIATSLNQRLEDARKLRNGLMHRAAAVTVRQSGEMQTTVRDLWTLLLDQPFELAAAWSMRI